MTQTAASFLRRCSLYVAAGLVLAGLGLALAVSQQQQQPSSADVTFHRIDAIPSDQPLMPVDDLIPAVTRMLGAGELSFAQATELRAAADRVCEGFTDGVPVSVMDPTLMGQEGLTGEQAHQFVQIAHEIQCPLA